MSCICLWPVAQAVPNRWPVIPGLRPELPSLAAAILHCAPKMVVGLPKWESLIGSEDEVEIPFG